MTLESTILQILQFQTEYEAYDSKPYIKLLQQVTKLDFADILREIVQKDSLVQDISNRSYIHPNGFDKITLYSDKQNDISLRLHIWWPYYKDTHHQNDIHNHRGEFASLILTGTLKNSCYIKDEKGQIFYSYRDYFDKQSSLHKFDFVGQEYYSLRETQLLEENTTYSLKPEVFHKSSRVSHETVATLVMQCKPIRDYSIVLKSQKITDTKLSLSPRFFYSGELMAHLEKLSHVLMEQR